MKKILLEHYIRAIRNLELECKEKLGAIERIENRSRDDAVEVEKEADRAINVIINEASNRGIALML